ncbi:hypothetical protein [Swaminathania salitolerans]|uniref:Lipoprotein n=1 Tax=Swaminathania salitolerans TaxID=182838 RepID=A0A511BQ67_9PROT|nr:hypothetical protein [Swaminathania salitolerans]GBQ13644.1 hypothetical protein AA21291_1574 [Swaminathania salitolerans LMG 21291]GEL01784.1 hypothetical protein SSA02_09470 [Swaminathania salitolerans]
MRPFLLPCILTALTLLTGCAGKGGGGVMENRSPSVLLTSYAIANGMAEHGLISRILRHDANRADIARLIAVDHNTWISIRRAAAAPTRANYRLADEGIARILDFSTSVEGVPATDRPARGALSPQPQRIR